MIELVAFLNVCLDNDEWIAQQARADYFTPKVLSIFSAVSDARHVYTHNPARVLREVAAKRAILRKLITDLINDLTDETAAWMLKTMAEVYRDHPDWREEWAT